MLLDLLQVHLNLQPLRERQYHTVRRYGQFIVVSGTRRLWLYAYFCVLAVHFFTKTGFAEINIATERTTDTDDEWEVEQDGSKMTVSTAERKTFLQVNHMS